MIELHYVYEYSIINLTKYCLKGREKVLRGHNKRDEFDQSILIHNHGNTKTKPLHIINLG
jgi:hypothetical protein